METRHDHRARNVNHHRFRFEYFAGQGFLQGLLPAEPLGKELVGDFENLRRAFLRVEFFRARPQNRRVSVDRSVEMAGMKEYIETRIHTNLQYSTLMRAASALYCKSSDYVLKDFKYNMNKKDAG